MKKTLIRILVVASLAVGLLAITAAAAQAFRIEVPIPGTPCKYVIEGDVNTANTPPVWAHGHLKCSN